jgi:hypothetical protein
MSEKRGSNSRPSAWEAVQLAFQPLFTTPGDKVKNLLFSKFALVALVVDMGFLVTFV